MEEQIVFGEQMIPVKLPENVFSAPPGLSTTLSPVDDVISTFAKDGHHSISSGRHPLDDSEVLVTWPRASACQRGVLFIIDLIDPIDLCFDHGHPNILAIEFRGIKGLNQAGLPSICFRGLPSQTESDVAGARRRHRNR